MGETSFASAPVAAYGVVLLLAAIAYYILSRALIRHHGSDSTLATAVGSDVKGIVSIVIYVGALGAAFFRPWIACALYTLTAIMWLVPDRRIERALSAKGS
jgi:uncharacterized membrane protein